MTDPRDRRMPRRGRRQENHPRPMLGGVEVSPAIVEAAAQRALDVTEELKRKWRRDQEQRRAMHGSNWIAGRQRGYEDALILLLGRNRADVRAALMKYSS